MSRRDVRVFPDAESLAVAAAEEIARRASNAWFSIGLAGGSTPRATYAALASMRGVPWNHVHLFWSDERYVPHDSLESNYRMARETLIERIAIPAENVHPIPTFHRDPADAAGAYEQTLNTALDLCILGLGSDGHTASLFPGSESLLEVERSVVVAHAPIEPSIRITLTLPMLARSAATLFLVSGAGKHEVVRTILDRPDEARRRYPAAMIDSNGEEIWMLDQAAFGASSLGR